MAIPLACGTPLEVLAHRVKWDEMEVDEEYSPHRRRLRRLRCGGSGPWRGKDRQSPSLCLLAGGEKGIGGSKMTAGFCDCVDGCWTGNGMWIYL